MGDGRGTLWVHLREDEERADFFQVLTGLSFYCERACADRLVFVRKWITPLLRSIHPYILMATVSSFGNRVPARVTGED